MECGAVPSAQGRSAYRRIYDIPDMASGQASFGALAEGGAAQPWDKKGVGKVESLRNEKRCAAVREKRRQEAYSRSSAR